MKTKGTNSRFGTWVDHHLQFIQPFNKMLLRCRRLFLWWRLLFNWWCLFSIWGLLCTVCVDLLQPSFPCQETTRLLFIHIHINNTFSKEPGYVWGLVFLFSNNPIHLTNIEIFDMGITRNLALI